MLSQDCRLKAVWAVFTFQEHDKDYNFRLSPRNASVPQGLNLEQMFYQASFLYGVGTSKKLPPGHSRVMCLQALVLS